MASAAPSGHRRRRKGGASEGTGPSNAGSNRRSVRCCLPEPGCQAGLWACRGRRAEAGLLGAPVPGLRADLLMLIPPPPAFQQEAHSGWQTRVPAQWGPVQMPTWSLTLFPAFGTVPGPDPQARLAQREQKRHPSSGLCHCSFPREALAAGVRLGQTLGTRLALESPARPPAQRSRSFLSTGLPFSRNRTHFNLRALAEHVPTCPDAVGEGPVPSSRPVHPGKRHCWHLAPLWLLPRAVGQEPFVQVP